MGRVAGFSHYFTCWEISLALAILPAEPLAHGDTSPLLTLPEFQMFYRYNLEIFTHLNRLAYFTAHLPKLSAKHQLKFFRHIIKLEKLPNQLAQKILYKPWDLNQFRITLEDTQPLLVYGVKQSQKRRKKYAAKMRAPADFCAAQVMPPAAPTTEIL